MKLIKFENDFGEVKKVTRRTAFTGIISTLLNCLKSVLDEKKAFYSKISVLADLKKF